MKPQFVGKEIAIITKSGKSHKGVLKRPLKEEVVIETEKGKELAIYKDCIECWFPIHSEEAIRDASLFVVRCNREKPKCNGRIAFDDGEGDKLKSKCVCKEFNANHCSVIAGDFYEMDIDTHLTILGSIVKDVRSKEQLKQYKTKMAKAKTKKEGESGED